MTAAGSHRGYKDTAVCDRRNYKERPGRV